MLMEENYLILKDCILLVYSQEGVLPGIAIKVMEQLEQDGVW